MSGVERKQREPGLMIGRRELIGSVALVGGGIAASAVVPWPQAALAATPVEAKPEPLSDWTIDDMWGVYPRYADPIDFGRAPLRQSVATVGSIEELFYA
jgi:hypothetical protein